MDIKIRKRFPPDFVNKRPLPNVRKDTFLTCFKIYDSKGVGEKRGCRNNNVEALNSLFYPHFFRPHSTYITNTHARSWFSKIQKWQHLTNMNKLMQGFENQARCAYVRNPPGYHSPKFIHVSFL